eukprot:7306315-Prymnesium_polylepis.1
MSHMSARARHVMCEDGSRVMRHSYRIVSYRTPTPSTEHRAHCHAHPGYTQAGITAQERVRSVALKVRPWPLPSPLCVGGHRGAGARRGRGAARPA